MMVAPLFAGEPGRQVVMPQGAWHDFWTGEKIDGGTEFSLPASTARIPVYVKSGSIIPWAEVGLHAGAPETRRLSVRVYGDGSLPFSMRQGREMLRLSWTAGRGSTQGSTSYEVIAWKQVG